MSTMATINSGEEDLQSEDVSIVDEEGSREETHSKLDTVAWLKNLIDDPAEKERTLGTSASLTTDRHDGFPSSHQWKHSVSRAPHPPPDYIHEIEFSYNNEHGNLTKCDLYFAEGSNDETPLVVFVHGGAWRSGDKSDHVLLARRIVKNLNCTVAVPNYRISPRKLEDGPPVRHPTHASDLLTALTTLHNWPEGVSDVNHRPRADKGDAGNITPTEERHEQDEEAFTFVNSSGEEEPPPSPQLLPIRFKRTHINLIGHSCATHMILSLLFQPPASIPLEYQLPPGATPPSLHRSIKDVVLTEGLYDFDLLLKTFPSYIDFISGAFGTEHQDSSTYSIFSPVGFTIPDEAMHIRWLILHSKGDELIDQAQSERMYETLVARHKAAKSDWKVNKNWDTFLTELHDHIFDTKRFIEILESFFVFSDFVDTE